MTSAFHLYRTWSILDLEHLGLGASWSYDPYDHDMIRIVLNMFKRERLRKTMDPKDLIISAGRSEPWARAETSNARHGPRGIGVIQTALNLIP